jgi:small subunit ribosomal protein S17
VSEERGNRKVKLGTVVSAKMEKTVVVAVQSREKHPLYKKYITRTKKFKAHDENNECHAGDVVIIPQYVLYKIDTSGDNPHINFWLHFDLGDIMYQKQLVSLISDSYIAHIGVNDELIALYKKLEYEFYNQTPGSRAVIISLVIQILVIIIRLKDTGSANKGIISNISDRTHIIIERCVRYITDKKGMVSVSDICRDMFISPSYIRRLIVRAFGIPPSELIRIIRLREAEIMLLSLHAEEPWKLPLRRQIC